MSKEIIKFKCHWCEEILKNGEIYSLECKNCDSCKIKFDRSGKVVSFIFDVIENGKIYQLDKPLSSRYAPKNIRQQVNLYIKKNGYNLILFQAEANLEFKDGIPQVQKMFNKLKIYNTFS